MLLETSRMVYIVDGDVAMVEKLSSSVSLKYKQRNLSAIRQFPDFYGRNSPRVNPQPINSGVVCANGESSKGRKENDPRFNAKAINDAGMSEDREISKCCGNNPQLVTNTPTPSIEDVAVVLVESLKFGTADAHVEPSWIDHSRSSGQIGSPLSLCALNREFSQSQRQKAFPVNVKRRKGGVVSANRTFPDGCGRGATLFNATCNDHGILVGSVKNLEGVVVSATRTFPYGCEQGATLLNEECNEYGILVGSVKSSKGGVVSANRTFPDGCGRGARLFNARCNEHGVKAGSVKDSEVKAGGVFSDLFSVEQFSSRLVLGSFTVTESSDHVKRHHLPKAFKPETVVPLIKLEATEPMGNLEPMAVDTTKPLNMMESVRSQNAPPSDQETEKDRVVPMNQDLFHNLSAEDSDGALAELPVVKHSGNSLTIGTFDITDPSGQVGSSQVPKCMIPETTNALNVLDVGFVLPEIGVQTKVSDHSHASYPVETVESRMQKKYPPRRRVSACRDFPPRFAMDTPSCFTEESQALGKSIEDTCLGNKNADGQSSDEHIVRDDTNDKTGKFQNEDITESRLHANILITEEVGDDAQVKWVQVVDKLVHAGEVLERKMKEANMDETSIQSPQENKMSQSDAGSLSASKNVDGVGSGDNVGMEFAGSITDIGSKRKFSGNPVEESLTVNSRMQGYVGLEQSESFKFPCNFSNSATECKKKMHDFVVQDDSISTPWSKKGKVIKSEEKFTLKKISHTRNVSPGGVCQITRMNEDYFTGHDKEDDSPLPETSHKYLLRQLVDRCDGNDTSVTCCEVGKTIPLVQVSHKMDSSLIPFGLHSSLDRDEDNEAGVSHNEFEGIMRSDQTSHEMDVSLIPFGLHTSLDKEDDKKNGVTRIRVRETLRLFQGIVRKLLQDRESKPKDVQPNGSGRVDLLAGNILKKNKKWVNTGKPILGIVPGVEVGDEFHYRVELAVIGLHRPFQAGIDSRSVNGKKLATSIVASGGYADIVDSSDVLVYSGHGGIPTGKGKKAEDQKLERGNLALKNSFDEKSPVRVIRGYKGTGGDDFLDSRGKIVATYTYDGLYLVEKYWEEKGRYDTNVFKFQLKRIPGQPELAIKEVKKSNKSRVCKGLRVEDISDGKEKKPIRAINTVDNEDPPKFKYITNIIYPSWYNLAPPEGCGCTDGCSDSENCFCARRNGGEIPFNCNRDIVEAKPLVYECGPSCKCPPTCHNRASQHGIKFQLEIFKTKSRGWGVRSLNSIPSGSFICEYTGELLQDKEAEQRTSNDEYLFDIGHNYNDRALWEGLSDDIPVDSKSNASCEPVEEEGFTIDAAYYGSVGRFLNHSCSPNLYAQNVLYDHDDKSMPHIMLFAAENIPPLQELTYHYNYEVDQVHDSDGNIKKKNCYCGSVECTGRMY